MPSTSPRPDSVICTNLPLCFFCVTTWGFLSALLPAEMKNMFSYSGRTVPSSLILSLPSRIARLLAAMERIMLAAFAGPHSLVAASSIAALPIFSASLSGSIRPVNLNFGAPPFMPSPGLKMSSQAARRPLRMTGLEDAKLLMSMLSKFQFSEKIAVVSGRYVSEPVQRGGDGRSRVSF